MTEPFIAPDGSEWEYEAEGRLFIKHMRAVQRSRRMQRVVGALLTPFLKAEHRAYRKWIDWKPDESQ